MPAGLRVDLASPAGHKLFVEGHRLLVDDWGRVTCPRRLMDVKVERCYSCGWLRATHLMEAPRWVRCARPRLA